MFYRAKFDGFVGGILKHCGYDTSAALGFWPAGATAEWIKRGKSKGWKPIEAAALGVSQTALERQEAGQIDAADAQFISNVASQVASENGARREVIEHLAPLTYVDIWDER